MNETSGVQMNEIHKQIKHFSLSIKKEYVEYFIRTGNWSHMLNFVRPIQHLIKEMAQLK